MMFKTGDRVKLKPGGKEMTVVQYMGLGTTGLGRNSRISPKSTRVKCSWNDSSKKEYGYFDETDLELL